jgi:hypothetical protein
MAKPPADAAGKAEGAPRTIRIKPGGGAPSTVKAGKPPAARQDEAVADTARTTSSAEKRKTSRISLESVLGADAETAEDAGYAPKTIRLKRPTGAASAKVSTAPRTIMVAGKPAAQPAGGQAKAGDAPTVRKTVRVKRPTRGGKPSIAVARPNTVEAKVAEQAAPLSAGKPDKVCWAFPVMALAAVLVICIAVYMFAVQVLGPNFSLTQFSYSPTAPDLPWPGKLLRTQ